MLLLTEVLLARTSLHRASYTASLDILPEMKSASTSSTSSISAVVKGAWSLSLIFLVVLEDQGMIL